jgi:hypothetical protein
MSITTKTVDAIIDSFGPGYKQFDFFDVFEFRKEIPNKLDDTNWDLLEKALKERFLSDFQLHTRFRSDERPTLTIVVSKSDECLNKYMKDYH